MAERSKQSEGRVTGLPEYKDPPVNEVALGVQFEAPQRPVTPFIGLFWERVRSLYPQVEVQAALDPVVELFGLPRLPQPEMGLRLLDRPETPRCWFIGNDGTELLQVQQDRFIRNWRRRRSEDAYPRYEQLRRRFARDFAQFLEFFAREELGPIVPNQCEVTYINHLVYPSVEDRGRVERLLSVWTAPAQGFLPQAEDVRLAMRFVIPGQGGEPLGRLHVSAQPAVIRQDATPIIALSLTARGRPASPDAEGVMRFFETGHEWIVRAFDQLTTPTMHRVWGKV